MITKANKFLQAQYIVDMTGYRLEERIFLILQLFSLVLEAKVARMQVVIKHIFNGLLLWP